MTYLIIYAVLSALVGLILTAIYYALFQSRLHWWQCIIFLVIAFVLNVATWPLQVFYIVFKLIFTKHL